MNKIADKCLHSYFTKAFIDLGICNAGGVLE